MYICSTKFKLKLLLYELKIRKRQLIKLLITERRSFEEVGRLYNCSGSNIRNAVRRLGINIAPRRNINPQETFRKGTAKKEYVKIVVRSLYYI